MPCVNLTRPWNAKIKHYVWEHLWRPLQIRLAFEYMGSVKLLSKMSRIVNLPRAQTEQKKTKKDYATFASCLTAWT
jgi:hypothetical protein